MLVSSVKTNKRGHSDSELTHCRILHIMQLPNKRKTGNGKTQKKVNGISNL